jgi:hypothetical protein
MVEIDPVNVEIEQKLLWWLVRTSDKLQLEMVQRVCRWFVAIAVRPTSRIRHCRERKQRPHLANKICGVN